MCGEQGYRSLGTWPADLRLARVAEIEIRLALDPALEWPVPPRVICLSVGGEASHRMSLHGDGGEGA